MPDTVDPDRPEQLTAFDVRPLDVATELKDRLRADGKGLQAKRDIFDEATIKQVVLAYDLTEYDEVCAILARLRTARNADNNAEPVLWLLRLWLSQHSPPLTAS